MSERAVEWRRVSRGLIWIGFGTFLLMTTLGVLQWSFWLDALRYWPILLVGLGIRIIFERTRTPWAILLSPLVILGTLTLVAVSGPRGLPGDWEPVSAERSPDTESWTLSLGLAFASLDVDTGDVPANVLVEGRAAARRSPTVWVSGGAAQSRVRLRSRRREWVAFFPSTRERWELDVARDLPMRVDLDAAFTGGELDLTSVPVTRVDMEGAFNDVVLRLPAPESDVRLDFQGAFNVVEVHVPKGTRVTTSTDGFLTFARGRRRGGSDDGPRYKLKVEGAFSRAVIRYD